MRLDYRQHVIVQASAPKRRKLDPYADWLLDLVKADPDIRLIDIQAHSKTHRNLIERASGETDERYRQMLELEARAPREALERKLPGPVRQYAYPYGDANDAVLDVLGRQQYQLAVTVNPGGNTFYAQPLMLRRTMIYGDHDIEAFKSRLQISRVTVAP